MDNLSKYFEYDNISMRRAAESDISELVSIINEAYSYQDKYRPEQRTNTEHLGNRICDTDFYVLHTEKEITGCVYVEEHEKQLHFGLLTVTPAYRGKGVAKQVMHSIDEYATKNNFESIELDYMSIAPWLQKYYEKYGYSRTNQIEHWGRIDLIRMSKRV